MSIRDLAALICKGLSLYSLVLGVGAAGSVLSMMLSASTFGHGAGGPQQFGYAALPAALYLAASFVLWLCASPLSHAMTHGLDDGGPRVQSSASSVQSDWRAFGVRLVGLLVLVLCLPQVARLGVSFLALRLATGMTTEFGDSSGWDARTIPEAIEVAARLLVGLWLLKGTPGVLRMMHALRDAGRDEPRE